MATPPVFTAGQVLTAAQMNDIGMWLVGSSDYTTVTSVTLNDVFTSDFRNYKLFWSQTTGASSGNVTIQFTVAGTATTTNYLGKSLAFHSVASGLELSDNTAGTDEILISFTSSNAAHAKNSACEVTIYEPQTANVTKVHSVATSSFGANPLYWNVTNGLQTDSTQFDGCKILFPGNSTGTIRIYGMRN
jgi:hypothetical protein